ncbi:hypothetical protein E2C01_029750 [Portunus trituberculatus]|uniref:Uncharacterized protein n=1 Tax=Portunus trituberculatus TaxID=210409 RepID=A0A5B7ET26_PORTR|nr:hypothetical protein [Portunus trituberculatus]
MKPFPTTCITTTTVITAVINIYIHYYYHHHLHIHVTTPFITRTTFTITAVFHMIHYRYYNHHHHLHLFLPHHVHHYHHHHHKYSSHAQFHHVIPPVTQSVTQEVQECAIITQHIWFQVSSHKDRKRKATFTRTVFAGPAHAARHCQLTIMLLCRAAPVTSLRSDRESGSPGLLISPDMGRRFFGSVCLVMTHRL